MTSNARLDGVLIEWGERLFYPPNRIVAADNYLERSATTIVSG